MCRCPKRVVSLALIAMACVSLPVLAQRRQPQERRDGPQGRGARQMSATAQRIEQRSYLFPETNQQLEYAVFVSSKVNRRNKSPLVIALHGLGVPPIGVLRPLTDAAEAGGYVVAAPMGYSLDGWYGVTGPAAATAPERSEK